MQNAENKGESNGTSQNKRSITLFQEVYNEYFKQLLYRTLYTFGVPPIVLYFNMKLLSYIPSNFLLPNTFRQLLVLR